MNAQSDGTLPLPVSARAQLWQNNSTNMVVGSPSSVDSGNTNKQDSDEESVEDNTTEEDSIIHSSIENVMHQSVMHRFVQCSN